MLILVINYELLSYLLHYSSARYITFKKLFVCKSNNKTRDFEMNLLIFFFSHKFFCKSGFIRRHTIAQKNFERTCVDYRISIRFVLRAAALLPVTRLLFGVPQLEINSQLATEQRLVPFHCDASNDGNCPVIFHYLTFEVVDN